MLWLIRKSKQSHGAVRLFSGPEKRLRFGKESEVMLWTIFVILVVLWLLGFIGHIGGGLIHILLAIAVIVLIVNLLSGRRTV